jgi:hypothetical protein
MDLVHEEAMNLTTAFLTANANVHDLDALMSDLSTALSDPNVVIIIPGRGTTNTLTPLGQGSQMVEEGHRSFLRGLLGLLGGQASEMVGRVGQPSGLLLRTHATSHARSPPPKCHFVTDAPRLFLCGASGRVD